MKIKHRTKMLKRTMFVGLLCLVSGCKTLFTEPAHMAKITVHVIDESGKPVVNAPVRTGTISGYRQPSEWWGYVTDYKEISVPTDKNGIAVISIPKTESSISYGVRDFPGYYDGGGYYEFKKVGAGPWQPWNPTVELVLKRIGVQVPMYARQVWDQKIPVQGKPVGFDLVAGDWMPPYGKGTTADFIFQLDSTITKTDIHKHKYMDGTSTMITNNLYDYQFTLRFSNEGDGIQYATGLDGGLRLPRLAPTEGYQPILNKREWLEQATNQLNRPFIQTHTDYDKDANYFFRVRTKKDSNGNIVSALYGKIYGDFSQNIGRGNIYFTYYLNPEPNSLNMEFNTKSNLFKNFSSLEQVSYP